MSRIRKVKEHFFYITGGMLEVQPHLVTVLADTALRGDQLDEAAALQAQQEAEEALKGVSEETDLVRGPSRSSQKPGPVIAPPRNSRASAESQRRTVAGKPVVDQRRFGDANRPGYLEVHRDLAHRPAMRSRRYPAIVLNCHLTSNRPCCRSSG